MSPAKSPYTPPKVVHSEPIPPRNWGGAADRTCEDGPATEPEESSSNSKG